MSRDKYILIGSDIPSSITTIIKSISGLSNYTCVTATKNTDTIQLARSLKPSVIILYFREVQNILNNLKSFKELAKLPVMCLTHKFQRKEVTYNENSVFFIQSYEDSIIHNNLKNNVRALLRAIKIHEPNGRKDSFKYEAIKSTYEKYNNNLARYTLELDQKRAMLNKVKQRIKQLCISTDHTTRSKLVSLLNTIKISSGDTSHWEDFKMYFEDINPFFVKRLSKKFPKLTSKDLKYCCYLKMNMSNEDIRNILGINQESVRTHKYRLKRKMTLSKEENLKNFLHSFTG